MQPDDLRSAVLTGRLFDDVADPPTSLKSVVWFHATRIPRDVTYQEGLLPTPEMAPRLLRLLHELAIGNGMCSEAEWQAAVRALASSTSRELSWKRSLGSFDDGPHGFLVREAIIDPGDIPLFDYTAEPEYVRCLCDGFPDIGARLRSAYRRTTRRAIVPFRSRSHLVRVIPCALRYIHAKLLNSTLHPGCSRGFTGQGHAIPAADVFPVEWLD
jgi:hypothetical protein